jgi:hypothetical protein
MLKVCNCLGYRVSIEARKKTQEAGNKKQDMLGAFIFEH